MEEISRKTSGREESVGGLRAWTNYSVTVAAVTRAGVGVASPDLTCTTREDGKGNTVLGEEVMRMYVCLCVWCC